ncbi:MAG: hypothetical protein IJD35_04315 [Clostridia bacterium]|nr:hypothetical protein [Clostridia bacterium]
MKKSMNLTILCVCIMLSFMTLFTSIGYAALTGKLEISGTAEWNEPATIYITDVRAQGDKTNVTPTVTKAGFVVLQHGNYSLNRQQGTTAGGSVTITLTVKNNSGIDQYFAACQTTPALPQRSIVSYPDQFKPGSMVKHGTTQTFRITIQNSQTSALNMNQRESMLIFSPDFDESMTQGATENLSATFANVLAGTGPKGDGSGIVYRGQTIPANRIMQTLADSMENVDTGGYIGNVGNATQEQKDLINAIFGEDMMMQIGSSYYSVSLLIKNQQIDGRGENDMVMYITADQLTLGGGTWRNNRWQNLNNVPVYGIVFINDGRNNYTYCDHLFAGEAPVCNLGGEMGEGRVGNFNTNIWNSTEYPDLTDTSGGEINEEWSSTNGELDEAYQRYVRENR